MDNIGVFKFEFVVAEDDNTGILGLIPERKIHFDPVMSLGHDVLDHFPDDHYGSDEQEFQAFGAHLYIRTVVGWQGPRGTMPWRDDEVAEKSASAIMQVLEEVWSRDDPDASIGPVEFNAKETKLAFSRIAEEFKPLLKGWVQEIRKLCMERIIHFDDRDRRDQVQDVKNAVRHFERGFIRAALRYRDVGVDYITAAYDYLDRYLIDEEYLDTDTLRMIHAFDEAVIVVVTIDKRPIEGRNLYLDVEVQVPDVEELMRKEEELNGYTDDE